MEDTILQCVYAFLTEDCTCKPWCQVQWSDTDVLLINLFEHRFGISLHHDNLCVGCATTHEVIRLPLADPNMFKKLSDLLFEKSSAQRV